MQITLGSLTKEAITLGNLPTAIAQAIASLGLTLPQAARKRSESTRQAYSTTLKRLHSYTDDPPTKTLALLEADLEGLGLEITITPKA